MYNSLQKARQKDLSGKIREVEKELQCLEEVLSGAVERADTD